jgi:DNA-directed RNA polymerase subunit RPC12/RpoP
MEDVKMKKFLSMALVLLLMLVLAVPAFADDPDDDICWTLEDYLDEYDFVFYRSMDFKDYKAGDTISMDVMLVGNMNFCMSEVRFEYDTSLLAYDEFTGSSDPTTWMFQTRKENPNIVYMNSVPDVNFNVGGPTTTPIRLVTLTFTVLDDIDAEDVEDVLEFFSTTVYIPPGIPVPSFAVDNINSFKHTWGVKEVVAPTCEDEGHTLYECARCKKTKIDDVIPALGHDWGPWVEPTPATCIAPGEETCICNRDASHIDTRPTAIDPDAHDWDDWKVTTDATCVAAGVETRICKLDPTHTETRPTAIDPDAHDWGPWTETTPATCVTTGVETRVCTRDASHIETNTLPIKPDNHTGGSHRLLNIPPTCQVEGLYSIICNSCGESITTDTLPKVEHFFNTYNVVNIDGVPSYKCIWCSDYIPVADILTAKGIIVLKDTAVGADPGDVNIYFPDGTDMNIAQATFRTSANAIVTPGYTGPATTFFAYGDYLYVLTLGFDGTVGDPVEPWRVVSATLRIVAFSTD